MAKRQEWGVSRIEAAARAERREGPCGSQRALTPAPEPSIPVRLPDTCSRYPGRDTTIQIWGGSVVNPAGTSPPWAHSPISRGHQKLQAPLPSLPQLGHRYAQPQATPVTLCPHQQRSLERCCVQLTQLYMEALRSALSQLLQQTLLEKPLARSLGHSGYKQVRAPCPTPKMTQRWQADQHPETACPLRCCLGK